MILQRVVTARQLLPRDVYFWLKAVLLALAAIQLARLVWALTTPLGPVGRWLPPAPAALPPAAQLALLSTFDPFAAASVATSAAAAPAPASGLTLFGTRMSMGSAPGSAIIAGADGIQTSYLVGEEVAPGLRLVGVGFDFVLLGGSGTEQRLAMEGAEPPAAQAGPGGGRSAGGSALTPENIRANVAFAPRTAGGRVTGLLVSPLRDPSFLARAGLRDGDVITAVNGRPVNDPAALMSQLSAGARLSLTVERGAGTASVALLLEG
jgi:general secretion pathway protein C